MSPVWQRPSRTLTQGGQGHDHGLKANGERKLIKSQMGFLLIRLFPIRLRSKRINRVRREGKMWNTYIYEE